MSSPLTVLSLIPKATVGADVAELGRCLLARVAETVLLQGAGAQGAVGGRAAHRAVVTGGTELALRAGRVVIAALTPRVNTILKKVRSKSVAGCSRCWREVKTQYNWVLLGEREKTSRTSKDPRHSKIDEPHKIVVFKI